MTMDTNKERALDLALGQIEKQFGKGAIMRLGQEALVKDIQVIPTGSLALDVALGVGGVPRGRVIEIYGPESSGKTTLALQIVAQAQKLGGVCAFVDAEHALDVEPDSDELQAALLRLYRFAGVHAAAAEQYTHYSATMRQLGVDPPGIQDV